MEIWQLSKTLEINAKAMDEVFDFILMIFYNRENTARRLRFLRKDSYKILPTFRADGEKADCDLYCSDTFLDGQTVECETDAEAIDFVVERLRAQGFT